MKIATHFLNCQPNSDVSTISNHDVWLSKHTKVPKAKHPEVVKTVSKAKVSDRTDCPVITQAHSSTPQLIDITVLVSTNKRIWQTVEVSKMSSL